jgi:outer membrane protein TolC
MKQLITLFTASLLSTTAFSQETYSLKKAIDYSLKNHGSTTIYINQVQQARLQTKEALSAYLPQVYGTVTFDDNLRRQTTILPGAMFGRDGNIPVQLGTKYNAAAVVQLDQTIYDQALLYGIKAGVPAKMIADLNLAKNNEELIYNTASAYSQILILKEQQKLTDANAKQYEELYSLTKFRFDKGVAKKVDMDRVTVQLNNIKSQQIQIKADIEVSYNTLKNAMGLPLNASLQIEDSIEYAKYQQAEVPDFNLDKLLDYKLQEQNVALQEIDVKRKESAYLPTITGYARYGQQSFSNDMNKAVTDWNQYSAVGVKMNIPIFSSGRRQSQLQQSKLELANTKENLALGSAQLQLQFQNAARQLKENITTLNANKNNMGLAKTVYETSQFEYSKGVITMADLLNADFSYKQAQTTYISSLLNLVSNRLRYERAKGSITQFVNQL